MMCVRVDLERTDLGPGHSPSTPTLGCYCTGLIGEAFVAGPIETTLNPSVDGYVCIE